MSVVSGELFYSSSHSIKIRNGDLIILYAGTGQELEKLVKNRIYFEEFKTVLIVSDMEHFDDKKCYLLYPRHITSLGKDIAELNAVIEKMRGVN